MTKQRADYSELDDDLLSYTSRLEQNDVALNAANPFDVVEERA